MYYIYNTYIAKGVIRGSHFGLFFSFFFLLTITLWYDMVGNVFIGFLDHENVGIDTKIMILCELGPELLRNLDFMAAILFLARQKFSSRVPKWHPADFGSG